MGERKKIPYMGFQVEDLSPRKFKIAKIGNYGIKKEYLFETFDELEKWASNEIEEYKKKNKVKDEAKDKSFIEYKFQIDMLVYNALNKID